MGARTEDRADPGLLQEVVVPRRDHAAADDKDVAGAFAFQRLDQRRHQRLVRRRLARHADDVHIILDRLPGSFFRRLEQRPDIDVEADIGKGGGDDLGAAVVPILAELDHQHARPPAFLAGETLDLALDTAEAFVALIQPAIDAGDRLDRGAVAGEHRLERVGYLADRGARPGPLARPPEEVAGAAPGRPR